MTAYYLKEFAPGLPVAVVYVLVGVSAFVGAVLLYEIIRRVPVVRWCVLGMKRKDK